MIEKKLVWDLPLRIFHWLFGLSIVATWIAIENQQEQLHLYLGYFIIFLLVFRMFWGFWGTRHSRFGSFFPTPGKAKNYLCDLIKGRGKETVGHNPLGSLMVFLMYALVAFQATTGLFLEGEMWSGPYEHTISPDTEGTLNSLHHTNFNLIQILILVHLLAVFGYLFLKKQNLIIPMITGKKKSDIVGNEGIANSRLWVALLIAAIVAGLVYWLIFVAPPPPPPPPSMESMFLY